MSVSLRKVKDFLLGVDDNYDELENEDYYDEPEEEYYRPEIQSIAPRREKQRGSAAAPTPVHTPAPTSNIRSISSNVVDLHKRVQIDISTPKNIEDARNIIDNIKSGIISIVNLEEVENPLAQRIADFLSGSVDALDGNIRRLSYDMFVIAPSGVDMSGEVASEIDTKAKTGSVSIPWLSTAFR